MYGPSGGGGGDFGGGGGGRGGYGGRGDGGGRGRGGGDRQFTVTAASSCHHFDVISTFQLSLIIFHYNLISAASRINVRWSKPETTSHRSQQS
jgi:hypothetical protein